MVDGGSCLKSEHFVIGVRRGEVFRKLFQVIFHRRDGSIFVNFPYFKNVEGLVSVATVGVGRESKIDLATGRVTSHGVKYSHHPDGTVLFTQDGKVRSEIRKKGVPLNASNGHLFSVHVTGPDAFDAGNARDDAQRVPNLKRTTLQIQSEKDVNRLKFVGWLYSVEAFLRKNPGKRIQPQMQMQQSDGTIAQGFVCASPTRPADTAERILVITVEEWVVAGARPGGTLLSLGGFDPPEVANDINKPTQMLTCSYPVDNAADLRARLGTIDFDPNANLQADRQEPVRGFASAGGARRRSSLLKEKVGS